MAVVHAMCKTELANVFFLLFYNYLGISGMSFFLVPRDAKILNTPLSSCISEVVTTQSRKYKTNYNTTENGNLCLV